MSSLLDLPVSGGVTVITFDPRVDSTRCLSSEISWAVLLCRKAYLCISCDGRTWFLMRYTYCFIQRYTNYSNHTTNLVIFKCCNSALFWNIHAFIVIPESLSFTVLIWTASRFVEQTSLSMITVQIFYISTNCIASAIFSPFDQSVNIIWQFLNSNVPNIWRYVSANFNMSHVAASSKSILDIKNRICTSAARSTLQ